MAIQDSLTAARFDELLNSFYESMARDTKPMYDTAHIGHRTYYDLAKNELQYQPVTHQSLFGMKLVVNPMFPYRATCPACSGTGEGIGSTFCPKCKGAGATMVDGMMTGARSSSMVLLTRPLPRKPVRWPRSVLVPKRPLPRR